MGVSGLDKIWKRGIANIGGIFIKEGFRIALPTMPCWKYIHELVSICFKQSKLVFDKSLISSAILLQLLSVLKVCFKVIKILGEQKRLNNLRNKSHEGVKHKISKIWICMINLIFMLAINIYAFPLSFCVVICLIVSYFTRL